MLLSPRESGTPKTHSIHCSPEDLPGFHLFGASVPSSKPSSTLGSRPWYVTLPHGSQSCGSVLGQEYCTEGPHGAQATELVSSMPTDQFKKVTDMQAVCALSSHYLNLLEKLEVALLHVKRASLIGQG